MKRYAQYIHQINGVGVLERDLISNRARVGLVEVTFSGQEDRTAERVAGLFLSRRQSSRNPKNPQARHLDERDSQPHGSIRTDPRSPHRHAGPDSLVEHRILLDSVSYAQCGLWLQLA